MLYREIIAVCSQINTKHINTLCGQNVQLLNVKLVVHHVTGTFHEDLHKILNNISQNSSYNESFFKKIIIKETKTDILCSTTFPKLVPFLS